jgi:NTE family protein
MHSGIVLVLGGLGLRGVANIGCLQALRAQNVKIERIVATGIGAIIAVQFALDHDLDQVADRFVRFFMQNHQYLWGLHHVSGVSKVEMKSDLGSLSSFLRRRLFCERSLSQLSVLPDALIEGILTELLGDRTTADLSIPVTVGAIDLDRREPVPLSEGKLVEIVHAAVALPGLFSPISIAGTRYTSSALYSELPLHCVPESDSPTVAIDLPQALRECRPRSLLEILTRADEGRSLAMKEHLLSQADTVIRLESVRRFSWGSYRRLPQLIQLARTETLKHLLQLAPDSDWLR